jgi:NCAIR mutase (PurE)-related protein
MGDDAKTMYENIGQFRAQVNDVGIVGTHRMLISCTNISSEYMK